MTKIDMELMKRVTNKQQEKRNWQAFFMNRKPASLDELLDIITGYSKNLRFEKASEQKT